MLAACLPVRLYFNCRGWKYWGECRGNGGAVIDHCTRASGSPASVRGRLGWLVLVVSPSTPVSVFRPGKVS